MTWISLWHSTLSESAFLSRLRRAVKWLLIASAFAVISCVIVLASAASAKTPARSTIIQKAIDSYRHGVVVVDRPETRCGNGADVTELMKTAVCRLIAYFRFRAAKFSDLHNFASTLYYVPLYVLGIFGLLSPRDRAVPGTRHALVLVCVAFIATFSALHMVSIVDFDWRYRLPILPHLLLLSGAGAEWVASKRASTAAVRRATDSPTG